MAALSADRNTLRKHVRGSQKYKVAAATEIFAGALVCVDAAGHLIPAADTAGITAAVGRAAEYCNNTGAAGDLSCKVEAGVFAYDNDGTVVQATVGSLATCLDDQTVSIAATTTNDITAGSVLEVEGLSAGDLVWVAVGL